jgi:hypothetical protein
MLYFVLLLFISIIFINKHFILLSLNHTLFLGNMGFARSKSSFAPDTLNAALECIFLIFVHRQVNQVIQVIQVNRR